MANKWLPLGRAPINTRILLQLSNGEITIGKYSTLSKMWIDDGCNEIVPTDISYYRDIPAPKRSSPDEPQPQPESEPLVVNAPSDFLDPLRIRSPQFQR